MELCRERVSRVGGAEETLLVARLDLECMRLTSRVIEAETLLSAVVNCCGVVEAANEVFFSVLLRSSELVSILRQQ